MADAGEINGCWLLCGNDVIVHAAGIVIGLGGKLSILLRHCDTASLACSSLNSCALLVAIECGVVLFEL